MEQNQAVSPVQQAKGAPEIEAIEFTLDGQRVNALAGQTLLDVLHGLGRDLPHWCAAPGLPAAGNCRACVVEVQGERALSAACCRRVGPGLVVQTDSARARSARAGVQALLGAQAHLPQTPLAGALGCAADPALAPDRLVSAPAPARCADAAADAADSPAGAAHAAHAAAERPSPEPIHAEPHADPHALIAAPPTCDTSHPALRFDATRCILCTRCVRACAQVQGHAVIGLHARGAATRLSFDLDDSLAESRCVACGECLAVCPTGALAAQPGAGLAPGQPPERVVPSVCPYCGVGCQIGYQVVAERVVGVVGRDGPSNHGRLCVKGRFGFDYIAHPQRLQRPLIRRADAPKQASDAARDPAQWAQVFREVSWDEALDAAAAGLARLRSRHGADALAGLGSAKGSNEEAYLFQKLIRVGLGTHNVDHCTRLCHASSVVALLEALGSGAVSNPVADVARADFILVIGSNTAENHPVAATWMRAAVRRGARLVVADPRQTELARHAWRALQFRPDADLALLMALLHTVFDEGLQNDAFIAARVDGVDAWREAVRATSPEAMAPLCGIAAPTLREVARAYARAPAAMIFWGMGVSQHVHGTDNCRALIALALVCGHIGRPGTGLHPLRGQNNVQGASDAGLLPMMGPNYRRVDDPAARAHLQALWGVPLSDQPGLTTVEILNHALGDAADPRRVRGLYVMGENPAMSDPDLAHARAALAALEHLVVQDLFLTETAWLADVVLPASAWAEKTGSVTNTDRLLQLGRAAVAPPGDARADLWILQQLGARLGMTSAYSGADHGVAAVFEEMRAAIGAPLAGLSWERLAREGAVQTPCPAADAPGQAVVFAQRFATASGRARLVVAQAPLAHLAHLIAPARTQPAACGCAPDAPAHDQTSAQYPLTLITGRLLEHWHTGAMTRRAGVLDALAPLPCASVHPDTLAALGLCAGAQADLASARGVVRVWLRADPALPLQAVFLPFAYREAAANLLTGAALDPLAKIPEFKFGAAQLRPVTPAVAPSAS